MNTLGRTNIVISTLISHNTARKAPHPPESAGLGDLREQVQEDRLVREGQLHLVAVREQNRHVVGVLRRNEFKTLT